MQTRHIRWTSRRLAGLRASTGLQRRSDVLGASRYTMRTGFHFLLFISLLNLCACWGAERTIGVFVALADNKSQGIVPVPDAIGNGNDPERNLYWGTADGFKSVFDRSKDWKLTAKSEQPASTDILRTRTYQNAEKRAVLYAKAYRGTAIKKCIRDFEAAVQTGSYDLVVFIGHNGLMDVELPILTKPEKRLKTPDCVVLCCKSDQYFRARITQTGGRPVLLTTQFMYPGAFILHAAANSWLNGESRSAIRESAGVAYAQNQKLAKKAGVGVFAELTD
jgi:hypothetical protein